MTFLSSSGSVAPSSPLGDRAAELRARSAVLVAHARELRAHATAVRSQAREIRALAGARRRALAAEADAAA